MKALAIPNTSCERMRIKMLVDASAMIQPIAAMSSPVAVVHLSPNRLAKRPLGKPPTIFPTPTYTRQTSHNHTINPHSNTLFSLSTLSQ